MIETITNALSLKLGELFSSIDIYEGDISQGLKEPCFIINIPGTNRQTGIMRKKQNITINLIYMEDKKNIYKEYIYYDVIDTLYKELDIIQADGEVFRVENLSHTKVDETLHFLLDVSFIYAKRLSKVLMGELDVNSEVKEDA